MNLVNDLSLGRVSGDMFPTKCHPGCLTSRLLRNWRFSAESSLQFSQPHLQCCKSPTFITDPLLTKEAEEKLNLTQTHRARKEEEEQEAALRKQDNSEIRSFEVLEEYRLRYGS